MALTPLWFYDDDMKYLLVTDTILLKPIYIAGVTQILELVEDGQESSSSEDLEQDDQPTTSEGVEQVDEATISEDIEQVDVDTISEDVEHVDEATVSEDIVEVEGGSSSHKLNFGTLKNRISAGNI